MTALDKTVTWIQANINQFALPKVGGIVGMLGGLKPLGELVLTMDILTERKNYQTTCSEIVSFAWEHVQCGDLLVETLTMRPDLIVLAGLYANFRAFGYSNKKLDELIALLHTYAACRDLEFPNWRRLDVLRAFDSLGLEAFPTDSSRNCWFYREPEPWVMSDDIAYAVTHDIFYITNFGRSITSLPLRSRTYLAAWLPSWLQLFSCRPNWDLTAELLMVAACIGCLERCAPFYQRLANSAENDGLIPSPSGAGAQLISLEGNPDDSRKRFLSNYHTCLVACMAFSLSTADYWPNNALLVPR